MRSVGTALSVPASWPVRQVPSRALRSALHDISTRHSDRLLAMSSLVPHCILWSQTRAVRPMSTDRLGMLYIDEPRLKEIITVPDAIRVLESWLRESPSPQYPRSILDLDNGQLLLMPASSSRFVGVKVASVATNALTKTRRVQGVYVLMDSKTLTPLILIDAAALTDLRTSALSALTAERLAVNDARTVVVFGSGPQAYAHVIAICCVRQIERVLVVGRDSARTDLLLARLRAEGIGAEASTMETVRDADIICTCTNARVPVFDGRLLRPYAHVIAVGTHRPNDRELDSITLERALITVEDRITAMKEAGDLVIAISEGAITEASLTLDLRELMASPVDPYQLTVFKSVGMAWEDLAVAGLLYDRLASRC